MVPRQLKRYEYYKYQQTSGLHMERLILFFYSLSLIIHFIIVYLPQNTNGNMKKNLIIAIIIATVLSACHNRVQNINQHSADLDSTMTMTNKTIYDRLLEELDSSEIYNDSILYGYWFEPHAACAVNIFFHKNGRFEFKYFYMKNDSTPIDVIKTGTFYVSDVDKNFTRFITLKADDGWDGQIFDGMTFNGIIQYKRNEYGYYLSDSKVGIYLVKGSN